MCNRCRSYRKTKFFTVCVKTTDDKRRASVGLAFIFPAATAVTCQSFVRGLIGIVYGYWSDRAAIVFRWMSGKAGKRIVPKEWMSGSRFVSTSARMFCRAVKQFNADLCSLLNCDTGILLEAYRMIDKIYDDRSSHCCSKYSGCTFRVDTGRIDLTILVLRTGLSWLVKYVKRWWETKITVRIYI